MCTIGEDKMERVFHLNGFLIFAREHEAFDQFLTYTWSEISNRGLYWSDNLRRKVFVDIRNDITFLTGWISETPKRPLGSLENLIELLKYAPSWNKTRFWMVVDQSANGILLDCETGKKVNQSNLID
jgi:hypothetical protein